MQLYNEKQLLSFFHKPTEEHTQDYKLFVAAREPENKSSYNATISLIVPLDNSEQILKSCMQKIEDIEFKGSRAELTENRQVDILLFSAMLFFDPDKTASLIDDEIL